MITKNRIAFFVVCTLVYGLILPLFSESYEVRKNIINTAIADCMADYRHDEFGSNQHKQGCEKCIGLGIGMMDAHGGLIDPIDYRMTIQSKSCSGYKGLQPVVTDLPKEKLVKISKLLCFLSFVVFFIPELSFKKIKRKLRLRSKAQSAM
jgi:hypothetical protein